MSNVILLESGSHCLLESGADFLLLETPAAAGKILHESGFTILLESGFALLMEAGGARPILVFHVNPDGYRFVNISYANPTLFESDPNAARLIEL